MELNYYYYYVLKAVGFVEIKDVEMSMSNAVNGLNMDTASETHFSWFTPAEKVVEFVASFPRIISNHKQSIHRPSQITPILTKITLTAVALKTSNLKDPSEALAENSNPISLVRQASLYFLSVAKKLF